MAQRGLLHVGGVVAAGAGVVGVPADFCAGGSLCVVAHTVMAQRGLLHVGGVVAAGAGFVSVPADFCAGGSLRVVGFELVVLAIKAADLPAARAGFRHRVLGRRACAWCIRVRVGACVVVRVLVGTIADSARPLRGAGGVAAGVFTGLRLIAAAACTDMLILVSFRPRTPVVVCMVGRTAVRARPLLNAGRAAAGVGRISHRIAARRLAGADMLILVRY